MKYFILFIMYFIIFMFASCRPADSQEKGGDKEAERIKNSMEEKDEHYSYWSEITENNIDPFFDMDYTGTSYYIVEIELEE